MIACQGGFGNHWPSRSGGAFESAGYRHIAGETLSYFHQRAREEHGDDTPALAMGDFNDEPFDTSLVLHALSTRQQQRVVGADTPRLWNLMWPAAGLPDGTFFFNNEPNLLDQFLVNANMARDDSPIRAEPDTVEILRFPGAFSTGRFPKPRAFGGMGKRVDENGFSDHFPIGMRVTEADRGTACSPRNAIATAHKNALITSSGSAWLGIRVIDVSAQHARKRTMDLPRASRLEPSWGDVVPGVTNLIRAVRADLQTSIGAGHRAGGGLRLRSDYAPNGEAAR